MEKLMFEENIFLSHKSGLFLKITGGLQNYRTSNMYYIYNYFISKTLAFIIGNIYWTSYLLTLILWLKFQTNISFCQETT